jgi:hypothetical protein
MQTRSEWQFSVPLEEVDVARIIREAQDATGGPRTGRGVIRFTIDGKAYTAIDVDRYPFQSEEYPDGLVLEGDEVAVRLDPDNVRVRRAGSNDDPDLYGEVLVESDGASFQRWIIVDSDTVSGVVDRVTVKVEVF